MTPSVRGAALLAWVAMVNGQYACPSGWTAKVGTPYCGGGASASCTNVACCNAAPTPAPTPTPTPAPSPTCSSYSSAWVIGQALGSGCRADNALMIFDLKKLTNRVASPQADSDITAACCTAFADATCADWNLMMCSAGQYKVGTNAAVGDSNDGMTLSANSHTTQCCVPTPAPTYTCASFSGVWAASQLVGAGCAEDKKFFDLKKSAVSVASTESADVKAACCTPFSDAKCSDWNLMMCSAGQYKVGTNAAPGQGSNGMTLTATKFKSDCCRDLLLCSSYSTVSPTHAPTPAPTSAEVDGAVQSARWAAGACLAVFAPALLVL